MRSAPYRRSRVVLAITLLSAGAFGCSTSAPKQTRLMREQTQLDISAEELRIKVRSLALPFSGIIEETADALNAANPGPESLLLSLRIKTNAIPAVQTALFDPDPLVALLDTWALVLQMEQMIAHRMAENVPDETYRIIDSGIDRMTSEITGLVQSIAKPGGYDHAHNLVQEWVRANPVETTLASRKSLVADLAPSSAIARPGIQEAIGSLAQSIGDVWARLDVYSAYLPKQARWEAETMVTELFSGDDPATAIEDFGRITDSIDRIAATVENTPSFVSEEREALLKALQTERIIALQTVSDELEMAYEFISRERIAAFSEGIAGEREAALEALSRERIATLEAIREERVAVMRELDDIVGGLSEDSLTRIADRILWRLALMLLVAVAAVAAIGYFVVRRFSTVGE